MRVVQVLLPVFVLEVAVACGGLPTLTTNATPAPPPVTKFGSNKEKIIGTWDYVKGNNATVAALKQTIEFKTESKAKINMPGAGPTDISYTLNGDKLKFNDSRGMVFIDTTITKLTDKELILDLQHNGMTGTYEFKKK